MATTRDATILHVLLVEDDPGHAAMIESILADDPAQARHQVVRAQTLAEGISHLREGSFDVVLADLHLPDALGIDLVAGMVEAAPTLPVIALTDREDDSLTIDALRHGAADCLARNDLKAEHLSRAIRYAIERKRQSEGLVQRARELERSNQELENYAHIVSHELKTPLWVVGYALELVRERFGGQFDDEAEKLVKGAQDAVVQARSVVDKLLSFAKVNLRGRPLKPTDTRQSLREALSLLQVLIEATESRVTQGDLPIVRGDGDLLVHLFRNLIENAIHGRSDRPQVIHVDARPAGAQWVFSVADQGVGIDPVDLPRIFDLFERGRNNHDSEGSGIGLAICKRIVELHGGRIWVESQVGQGTVFFFTLPAGAFPLRPRAAPMAEAKQ